MTGSDFSMLGNRHPCLLDVTALFSGQRE